MFGKNCQHSSLSYTLVSTLALSLYFSTYCSDQCYACFSDRLCVCVCVSPSLICLSSCMHTCKKKTNHKKRKKQIVDCHQSLVQKLLSHVHAHSQQSISLCLCMCTHVRTIRVYVQWITVLKNLSFSVFFPLPCSCQI